jgi:hypothetical protein
MRPILAMRLAVDRPPRIDAGCSLLACHRLQDDFECFQSLREHRAPRRTRGGVCRLPMPIQDRPEWKSEAFLMTRVRCSSDFCARGDAHILGPMSRASHFGLHATDAVALAVESHLHSMQLDGHGEFFCREDKGEIVLAFGSVEVRAENSDLALLRLASALLDHPKFSAPFLARMRNPAKNPAEVHLRDNISRC